MKTIVYFENEDRSCRYNSGILGNIRQLYQEEMIVMVSAGDFSACGKILKPSCAQRSKEYVKAGADIVLSLPAASVLGGNGKKEFAGAALVQRLRTADRLIVPCIPLPGQTPEECGKQLRSLAMLMFKEEAGYRGRLTMHLKNRLPLRDAQAETVCECVPEAKEILSCPENRNALWLLDAMLQLYYMAKVEFIAVPEGLCRDNNVNELFTDETDDGFDKTAAAKIAGLLTASPAEKLIDISGSTSQMVEAIIENKEKIREAGSLGQIVQLLAPAPEDGARLFLLKAFSGIRKIYMQICGLHVYVPYCRVTAANPGKSEMLQEMKEKTWVPFITEEGGDQKAMEDYYYLMQADKKVQELL